MKTFWSKNKETRLIWPAFSIWQFFQTLCWRTEFVRLKFDTRPYWPQLTETLPQHWRVESRPSFRFISIWMFLLICETSMGLTKASISLSYTQEHTHTIMLVWHPSEGNGHSIKPHPGHHENPGVLLRSTKKELATQWHGNHELMRWCCHILRGCQVFPPLALRCCNLHQVWSVNLMLFSKSFSCVSQWIESNDVAVGGVFVVYAVCLVSDSNMSEDLTETEWWFGKRTKNPETRIWTHIEKRRRQRGQWILLCNKNVVTWMFPQTNSSCFASDQLHVFVFCFL